MISHIAHPATIALRIKNDKSKRIGKIDLNGGGGRSLFDSSRAWERGKEKVCLQEDLNVKPPDFALCCSTTELQRLRYEVHL